MLKQRNLPMWLVPAAALGLLGCPDEELAPLEPCTVSGVVRDVATTGVDKVDLLFVIDNSGSMAQEQENIAEQLPRLVRILASGNLENGGPDNDFQPVSSLQLGVISSDMGTDDAYPLCEGNGDDGVLIDSPTALEDDPACAGQDFGSTSYLSYSPEGGGPDAAATAITFGCVAQLGTKGCGLEQQLEAMYKALTPSTVEADFIEGEGHGDKKNKGFVRDDAVLAVIQVSDEEDCSITKKGNILFRGDSDDPRFKYDGEPANLQGDVEGLNFRCAYEAEQDDSQELIRPIDRYVDGLLGLKPQNPDRVIFAAIVGIPQEAENMNSGDEQDFAGILAMDEMQIYPGIRECTDVELADDDIVPFCGQPGVTGATPPLPRPACTGPGGSASPARRFVKVAQGFAERGQGRNAIVRSICKDDFKSALDQILVKISDVLTGACLPRPLNPNNRGIVTCDVVEILGPGRTEADCKAANGRVPLGETRTVTGVEGNEERAACKVNQVPVIDGKLTPNPEPLPGVKADVGWYYDDFSDEVKETCDKFDTPQRITTTPEAELQSNAAFKFECFQPVGGDISSSGKAAVGAPCTSDNQCKSDDSYTLACEPTGKTCQIRCESDAQCPKPWICDKTNFEEGICNNPTCPATTQ
jgi:hypothetical protein